MIHEPFCKCMSWARLGTDTLFSDHHVNCPHRNIEDEAKKHLSNLLAALEYEANMGDGINEEHFKAYQAAKFFTTGELIEDTP